MRKPLRTLAALAALSLLAALTSCAMAGSGSGGDRNGTGADALRGRWCTGVKTDVWIDDENLSVAAFVVLEPPFYEGYLCAAWPIGEGVYRWTVVNGNRGYILERDDEYIVIGLEQELVSGEGWSWQPIPPTSPPYQIFKYALVSGSLVLTTDGNRDRVCGPGQPFESGATIDFENDVVFTAALQPATLTVSGRVTFSTETYTGPDAQLGVGVATNMQSPEHSASYPVIQDTTDHVDYSVSGVVPGIYFVGASVDLGVQGEYSSSEDWLGSYSGTDPASEPPTTPIFAGLTTFDFVVQEPFDP